MRLPLAAAVLLSIPALASAGGAAAATTLIAGEVNTDPVVNFLTRNASGGFDSQVAESPGHDAIAPNKLDLFAGTEAFENSPSGPLDAHASIAAHWNGADSGTIQTGGGWSLPSANLDPQGPVTEVVAGLANTPDPAWSYTFSVDRTAAFNIDFAFSARGDTDGLGFWDMRVIDNGLTLPSQTLLNVGEDHGFDVAGQASQRLTAGHTYTISLASGENHFGLGPQQPVSNVEDAFFRWSIEAVGVPEPDTWALAIAGFGLAGGALRRRARVEKLA